MTKVRILDLRDFADARGHSYAMPAEALEFVGRVLDLHVAQVKPGAVRGNHYHLRRREAIVVQPGPKWSLHWDDGEQTTAQHREFDGKRAVLVLIAPAAAHAVRNDGEGMLWFVAISSESYDPAESVQRKLI